MSFFTEKIPNDKFFMGPIEVKKSLIPGAGFGVFATEDIKKHALIERSPVVKFNRYILQMYHADRDHRHILADYIFKWPDGHDVVVCFGYGSYYNHCDDPNACWKYAVEDMDLSNQFACRLSPMDAIEFFAKREIKKGEEITTSYGRTSEFGSNNSLNEESEKFWSRKLF